ncbi:hypothetical protein D3C83_192350 [compost metagenome]
MMKISRMANLKFFVRKRAVTTFIFARKNTTVGIWNTMPIAMSILVYRPKTSLSLGRNRRSIVLKLAKNTMTNLKAI